jgi:bla regulator protein BlaR1
MKNIFKIIIITLMSYTYAHATGETCFMMVENGAELYSVGDVNATHQPRCSFNIALATMGFDSGVLQTTESPKWDFEKGFFDYVERWKQPHDPNLWMVNSCLWFGKKLYETLGVECFQDYVQRFEYGTQDVCGLSPSNGLPWMTGGSLKISACGQVAFLQKFLDRSLPVRPDVYEKVMSILPNENLEDSWKLYGKTGAGFDDGQACGWYVGFIMKGDRSIPFASYVEEVKQDTPASYRAKDLAMEKIAAFLQAERAPKP